MRCINNYPIRKCITQCSCGVGRASLQMGTDCQESKKRLTEFLLEDLGNSEISRNLLAKLSWKELSHLTLVMCKKESK